MTSGVQMADQPLIPGSVVVDAEGQLAHLLAVEPHEQGATVLLQLPHNRQIRVAAALLKKRKEGGYLLPFTFAEIAAVSGDEDAR